jgi:peptidoglycan/xylan/chitin deacetylase (PgdA/CDA1 family)
MSLDPAYLEYPRRGRGMDHERYAWSNLFAREPLSWPGDKAVAIPVVISLEWFPILPRDKPFRAPGHMVTPYPDYRHYTSREYGTRVGFYRLLDMCRDAGITASVATNSAIAERYPQIVEDIVREGHEIVAHATDMNAAIATGVSAPDQAAIIGESLDTLERVSGKRPTGWLSIARSQAFDTPDLLAEAGVEYMLDWVNDELPYRFATRAGSIVNLPLNHELSDRQIITVQQQSIDSYATQIEDACDWLEGESKCHGGRMLPLHLTPYITGLPYRIDALEALVQRLCARSTTWFATTGAIVAAASPDLPERTDPAA